MSQVFEQHVRETDDDQELGEVVLSGAPREYPTSSFASEMRSNGRSVGLHGFPHEGITVSVALRRPGAARTQMAIFREGPAIENTLAQDAISIFLSNDQMVKFSRKSGARHFYGLSVDRHTLVEDEVLCDLAMCLSFDRENPKGTNNHFAAQIVLAICAHVIERYGQARSASGRASNQLSPWQLRIAKKMLCGDMRTTPNLAAVADACRISTRHFTRSFTETIGTSPHQWSVLARLEHAKTILEDRTATLAETAVSCGFSDQSHFTRVFTREFGTSPARWRRTLDGNQG
jgi:AraC family transcriptional regulator